MRLVTFRKGRSQGRVGAIWNEAVIDLAGVARDLAVLHGGEERLAGAAFADGVVPALRAVLDELGRIIACVLERRT